MQEDPAGEESLLGFFFLILRSGREVLVGWVAAVLQCPVVSQHGKERRFLYQIVVRNAFHLGSAWFLSLVYLLPVLSVQTALRSLLCCCCWLSAGVA